MGHALVSTVNQQRETFTNREYYAAKLARQTQETAGCQSLTSFLHVVANNVFKNLSIMRRDVLNAETIFGPSVASLKGRTVRHKPAAVPTPNITILSEILQRHHQVTLVSDIFSFDRSSFLMTKSRNLKFTMVHPTTKQNIDTLFQLLTQVFDLYKTGRFRVAHLFADNQYEQI